MRRDRMKKGVIRSQHRDIFYSMCYTRREIDQPIVGVINSFNHIIPGHIHLNQIVDTVTRGVAMAGGTPVVFPRILAEPRTFTQPKGGL
jgi:dihydroxy-acid dehydratase